MSPPDDFYIGYESGMPASMRRPVALAVVAALSAAALVATIFVTRQRGLDEARFDYANEQTFEGYLSLTPTPALLVPGSGGVTTHWLVAPGKHGAGTVLTDARAGWVSLRGKAIARESWRMIEVSANSLRQRDDAPAPPLLATSVESREITLRGEIVDGKCYLGVMNPGERTVHRDCAVRCVSGGVPPMFAYRDDQGSHLAMLIGGDPESMRQQIGRQVTLAGVLSGPEESRIFDIGGSR
jgi:hypothetical protein